MNKTIFSAMMLVAVTGNAMTLSGNYIVYECPYCGAKAHKAELGSYNTFGATFWSDFFRIAPMAPSQDVVSRCWKCKKAFYIRSAKSSPVMSLEFITSNRVDNPYITLTGDYSAVKEALVEELRKADPYKELDLRMRLLWAANHKDRRSFVEQRSGKSIIVKEVPAAERRENLQRLSSMTNMPNMPTMLKDMHTMLMVEILREMGNFKEAKAVLTAFKKTHPEEYKESEKEFKKMEAHIEAKNAKVFVW